MNTLEPKATFKIGEAQIPVSMATITHNIDELPHAEVYVQLDNQTNPDLESGKIGSTKIDLAKFNWLTRLTQEKILNEYQVEPDTQLLMEDGTGSSILLKGFLGKPAFKLREGELNLAYSVVHAKAVMQAFNPSIYGAQELYTGSIPDGFFLYNAQTKKIRTDKSVAKSIQVILDGMIRGAVHLPDLTDSSSYDSYPIHLLNLTAFPKVKEFLKKSETNTEIVGLDTDEMRLNFQVELWNILTNAPNFFQAIGMICSDFMFQMNAEYEGDAWLEWHQAHTAVGDRVIEVPIQDLTFNMANIFQLPVLQVLVQGRGSSLYGIDGGMGVLQGGPNAPSKGPASPALKAAAEMTGDSAIQLTTLAKFPTFVPRDAVGMLYVVDAPNWITPDQVTLIRLETNKALAKGSRNKDVIKKYEDFRKHMTGANAARMQICEFMARQYFRSLFLGDTVATVTIPLNTRVRPGYMYLVKATTGEELITAYLHRVTHDLAVSPDGAGAAITHLVFSHVKVVGANINALAEEPTFPTALVIPKGIQLPAANIVTNPNLA